MDTMWEWLFSSKTTRIFQMVMSMTSWMTGLDQRLNKIERRLGSIEMALTARGISIPPIGGENDKTEK